MSKWIAVTGRKCMQDGVAGVAGVALSIRGDVFPLNRQRRLIFLLNGRISVSIEGGNVSGSVETGKGNEIINESSYLPIIHHAPERSRTLTNERNGNCREKNHENHENQEESPATGSLVHLHRNKSGSNGQIRKSLPHHRHPPPQLFPPFFTPNSTPT